MQHLIMLMHIQIQQMVHELAPPICVLKFKRFLYFSLPIFVSLVSLPLVDFIFVSLPFVINDQKGSKFSEK